MDEDLRTYVDELKQKTDQVRQLRTENKQLQESSKLYKDDGERLREHIAQLRDQTETNCHLTEVSARADLKRCIFEMFIGERAIKSRWRARQESLRVEQKASKRYHSAG